jgi:hypothetical protein
MKKVLIAGLALVSLQALAACARADGVPCGGGCSCGWAPPPVVVFRIEEEQEKYCVPVRVKNPVTVKEEVAYKDVPCTRLVPVCVTDPCTGCTRTEYKEEAYVKKVRTTVLTVIPPAEEYTCKTEERTRTCFKIYKSIVPTCCGPQ